MLNYELAKQLDEAGFQHTTAQGIFVDGKMRPAPTLSELIEACGYKFNQLSRMENEWIASEEIYYDDAGYRDIIGRGNTPEEAVAKLWLAVNK